MSTNPIEPPGNQAGTPPFHRWDRRFFPRLFFYVLLIVVSSFYPLVFVAVLRRGLPLSPPLVFWTFCSLGGVFTGVTGIYFLCRERPGPSEFDRFRNETDAEL